jgi:hypothetical protein
MNSLHCRLVDEFFFFVVVFFFLFASEGLNTIPVYFPKGKAIPLQAWTGPEGSRRLRLPDFKTIGT